MNAPDLRKLSPDEMADRVSEARQSLFDLQIRHTTGQLENTAKLGTLRKDIARSETLLREKRGATS